jgi:hypothetical protein
VAIAARESGRFRRLILAFAASGYTAMPNVGIQI